MGFSRAQTPPAGLCDVSTRVKLGQKLKRACQALSEVLDLIISSVSGVFSISRRRTRGTLGATLPWTKDTSCATVR